MGKVEIKSIGTLIDELITINNKIFWALEKANKAGKKGKKKRTGEYYGMAQRLNSKRGDLITAINERACRSQGLTT